MRDARSVLADLLATGLTVEQHLLVTEFAMSAAAETAPAPRPETPEERKKRISRETSARHRASRNVTGASPSDTSPNVTDCHQVTESDVSASPLACVEDNNLTSEVRNKITSEAKASSADAKPKASRDPTGTRLPDGWTPDEPLEFHHQIELDKFRDYWRGVPGSKGRKLDWPATWRNWLRNSHSSPMRPGNGTAKPASTRESRRSVWSEIAAREAAARAAADGSGDGPAGVQLRLVGG